MPGLLEFLEVDGVQLHPGTVALPAGATGRCGLMKVSGLGQPGVRAVVQETPQRHGVLDYSAFLDGRVVSLDGRIIASTDADVVAAWDAVSAAFQPGRDLVVRLTRAGLPTERFTARVSGPMDVAFAPRDSLVLYWNVALRAGDPRLYSDALKSGTYDPTTSITGGGTGVPLVFPLVFTTTTATHLEVLNAGNFETPPVLTVHGPAVNPIVDNDTLGESDGVVFPMGANDVVVIDTEARTVLLNGAPRQDLIDTAVSSWFNLASGTNKLRLRGTGMTAGVTSLTAEWRDART